MTTDLKSFRVIPYGRIGQLRIPSGKTKNILLETLTNWKSTAQKAYSDNLFVAFSDEIDESFTEAFRTFSTSSTKLLVLDDHSSINQLLSRMIDLRIRKAERFYIADIGSSEDWKKELKVLLGRLDNALATNESSNRIFDAKIKDNILHVASTKFSRMTIPLSKIPQFKGGNSDDIMDFEVDEDGSYIFWPRLDVHLGWEQLRQIVDPEAANRAKQKTAAFNARYGAAIKKLRKNRKLTYSDVPGLSVHRLRSIESGEVGLTSEDAEKLAWAHNMNQNSYLKFLASLLD